MGYFLHKYNPNLKSDEILKITKNVGLDKDHNLNFTDFLLVVFNFNKYLTQESLKKLFISIDKQNKGYLTSLDL